MSAAEAHRACLHLLHHHGHAVTHDCPTDHEITQVYQSCDVVIHLGHHGLMVYDCAGLEVVARAYPGAASLTFYGPHERALALIERELAGFRLLATCEGETKE